ncbi:FAD:protein FMN transferase [Tumebacillus permanentifrigoris]|uniref:FAD:protein FMN transferase n=1 Tax=Tumebacillus permanentifrigoris TaxID=378543 RepID=A0A316DFY7_9BACL|nr:FAD:protein FMN transferase [Tumebacillus permanentifrigoris]PWK16452.1 thiamine biosynthesis lipoprotein [Tumebacillus permanentifrigoris]
MSAFRPKPTYSRTALHMDTVVSLHVVSSRSEDDVQARIRRAFEAFLAVERVCSRFDAESELRRLCTHVGEAVQVSPLLFEATRIAWEMAELTDGVFDPTVGHRMAAHGFNINYLTGEKALPPAQATASATVTYRDLILDEQHRTVTLQKPLQLDLGAVAKGMAVDLAARELREFEGFLINAGGDIYAGGLNDHDEPWVIGIQHPTQPDQTITTLRISDAAVCTSGSYERVSPEQTGIHHLLDPRTGRSPSQLVSCTVVAPQAMLADAFSTAAFLLGPEKGQELVAEAGLTGVYVTPDLKVYQGEEEPS